MTFSLDWICCSWSLVSFYGSLMYNFIALIIAFRSCTLWDDDYTSCTSRSPYVKPYNGGADMTARYGWDPKNVCSLREA